MSGSALSLCAGHGIGSVTLVTGYVLRSNSGVDIPGSDLDSVSLGYGLAFVF